MLLLFPVFMAQAAEPVTITGTVQDSTGEPLTGVTVMLKGSSVGVSTDIDGNFQIKAPVGGVLRFSYIGFAPQEITIKNTQPLNVVMLEDSQKLDEVVVTALGIKRSEKALSYNVQKVGGDELTNVKDPNLMNALVGKVAGVQITSAANGAGGPTRVVMRGVKSLTHGNNALYVIDGVPMNNATSGANTSSGLQEMMAGGQPTTEGIADLNPEDIESISVLSGPSAAALYGSSAANGVVLITTKKGNAGQTHITFSNNTTFSRPLMKYQFQNTYGNIPGAAYSWGSKLATPTDYDPYDFLQTGTNVSNAITLSTGTQKNQTFLSLASENSTAIIPNSNYNRYNISLRNTTNFLDDKMSLDFSGNFIIQNQLNPVASGGAFNPLPIVYMWPRGEDFNEARDYQEWDPSRNIYVQRWNYGADEFGTGYAENPYWEMYRKNRSSNKRRYMFSIGYNYNIVDWLSLSARVKMDHSITKSENKYSATSIALSTINPLNTGVYNFSSSQSTNVYGDLMASVKKDWDKWTLSAQVGGSFTHDSGETNTYGGALSFMPNLFTFGNVTQATAGASYNKWKQREYAMFASAEVGFDQAIFLTATARNEWSSTLSNTSQLSYFFPSIGLSFILSEWIKMPQNIEYLKIRASYADVGSPLQRYLTEAYYTWNGSSASQPAHRPVTRLYPEKTKSWEIGLTGRFLKHMKLDVTLYKSNTYNQTIPLSISAASGGYTRMYIQSGDVQNKGIELSLGYENTWSGFTWSTTVTYSANRNRINKLFSEYWDPVTGKTYFPDDANISSGTNPIRVGGTMGDLYSNKDLLRDKEGNIWVDTNGKIQLTNVPSHKIGCTLPKGNIGWSNTFIWKGFTLNALFTARIGGDVISYTQMFLDKSGTSKNSAIARDNGGVRVNNGFVDAQSYYDVVTNTNGGLVQDYIYSGSNVRLQELTLAYRMPRKWFGDKMGLTLSFIGRNLWMIYCKAPFDPDLSYSTGTYNQGIDFLMMPSLRNLGFSVKMEF